MRIIDLETVTDGNPSERRISKDLFLYHGTWHDEDAHSFRLDTLYICFVEKGEHSFVLNSQHYTVRAGELLICHPNDFFSELRYSKDFIGLMLYTTLSFASTDVDPLSFQRCLKTLRYNPIISLSQQDSNVLRQYSSLIESRKLFECDNSSVTSTGKLCQAMLGDIFGFASKQPKASKTNSQKRPSIIFQDFIDLLASMNKKELNVRYYAEALSLTPKYLSAVCKTQSGKTAIEWIREYVMNDARRYLVGTDFSVKEIASHLGFSNFSFFCKSVKKFFGMTPLELRNSPLDR